MESQEYRVTWTIDVSALSSVEAIMIARNMFPGNGNISTLATCFEVTDASNTTQMIDLEDVPEYIEERDKPTSIIPDPNIHW
jgi:hypothetical protein